MKGKNAFPPLWVSSPAKKKPGAVTFGELSCSYFYILFHFFDLKNLSHWGLNQSRRFTWLLCSLLGTYHILYCRHFLTIHFNFNLEMEQTLAGEAASLKPPLTSRLRNWDSVPGCATDPCKWLQCWALTLTQVHTIFLHNVSFHCWKGSKLVILCFDQPNFFSKDNSFSERKCHYL